MDALNLKMLAKFVKGPLALVIELVGLWSCTDPIAVTTSTSTPRDDVPAVTMATSAPAAQLGEVVWLRLQLANLCREEGAAMGLTVSWNSERFEYISTPEDLAERGVYLVVEGLARIRVDDLRNPGREIDLPFRALVDGPTDGFVIEDVVLACGGSGDDRRPLVPTT